MRYDSMNMPFAVKVVDDATGQELKLVLWVDDSTMEYATFHAHGLFENVVKVTRVQVDWVARVIHVNDPPHVHATSGIVIRELHACDECCQEATCARINYCTRFKTGFGEASKP